MKIFTLPRKNTAELIPSIILDGLSKSKSSMEITNEHCVVDIWLVQFGYKEKNTGRQIY